MKLTKKLLLLGFSLILIFSCREKKTDDPYAEPWDTKYVSWQNVPVGSHSHSVNINYKERVVFTDKYTLGIEGCVIQDSCRLSSSTMFLFGRYESAGRLYCTQNGGLSWVTYPAGNYNLFKYHHVKPGLSYCVTYIANSVQYSNQFWFTGIGKSALRARLDTAEKGTNVIYDKGTDVTQMDSTIIPINDTISYVIRFK